MESRDKNFEELLKSEDMWIAYSDREYIPAVINEKYHELKLIIERGNSYHAILCAKELVENSFKIPAIARVI